MEKYHLFFVYLFAYTQVNPVIAFGEIQQQKTKRSTSVAALLLLEMNYPKLPTHRNRKDTTVALTNTTSTELQTQYTRPKRGVLVIAAIVAGSLAVAGAAGYGSEKLYQKIERGRRDLEVKNAETPKSPSYHIAVMDQMEDNEHIATVARRLIDDKPMKGFRCDDQFCKNCGNVTFSSELCAPEFCQCSDNVAKVMRCPTGLVYDLVNELCVFKSNLEDCGFIWEMFSKFSNI